MPSNIEKLSAIGAIELLPVIELPITKGGRLKNLLTQLSKADIKEVAAYWPISESDMTAISGRVDRFSMAVGWRGTQIPTDMWVEFALMLAEKYDLSTNLIEILNRIYDYFERDGHTKNQHSRTAAWALRVWENDLK